MIDTDYYTVLGVDKTVDPATLKKAYRKLARKYHPDVSAEANSEEKFKTLGEAYEVLKDPEKRAQYDLMQQQKQYGSSHSSSGNNQSQYQTQFNESDMADFSDVMDSIFNARASSTHRQSKANSQSRLRGEDIHARLALFIEQVHNGCERIIDYQLPQFDERGMIRYETKKIRVKIPANCSIDAPLRLKGQGGKGFAGGQNGDLYLDIELAPHPTYSTKGQDLYRKVAITPWEAALGGEITLNTLHGNVKMTIPEGSLSGQQLRLKGKGLKQHDLIVELDITVPKENSEDIKSLYRQIAKASLFNPRETEHV